MEINIPLPVFTGPHDGLPKQNNEKSPYLSIFSENQKCENQIPEEDIAYKFPYTLDAFQQEGIYRIYKNENILITAHTGSGKTVLAIYAIAHCLKMNKKVIYTSPTKSLSNQKYAEFIEKFDSVGIMTGDIKMNPDAQCIIMTTEILRNILYKETSRKTESLQTDINPGIIRSFVAPTTFGKSSGSAYEQALLGPAEKKFKTFNRGIS